MLKLPMVTAAADARFDCHSCGACCRGLLAGVRVEAHEAFRLEEYDWSQEGPLFARGVVEARLDDATEEMRRRLKTVDGRCIFLDEKNQCLVHLRLGWDAKPLPCKAFPYVYVEDPDGNLDAVASPACRSLHATFETGTPLAARPDVAALAATAPRRHVRSNMIALTPERDVPWIEVRALLEDLVAAANADGPLVELPHRMAWPVNRILGRVGVKPRTDIPREQPFYDALRAVSDQLSPVANAVGCRRLAAGFIELRQWGGFERTVKRLEPAAERFVRATLRIFIREEHPHLLPDVIAGVGAVLYLALAVAAGAVRIAEVTRSGAKGSAAEANEVAAEAERFLADARARDALALAREPLALLIFDAPRIPQ